MAEQIIEFEAESLEEAREQLKAKISESFYLLSERIISDGKPKTVKASADTIEAALSKAQAEVPESAEVIEKKELASPLHKKAIIKAFDEEAAGANAKLMATQELGEFGKFRSLQLVTRGSKGFIGIGKKPHQYEAELYREALVEIKYKTKARVSARIIDVESRISMLIGELQSKGSKPDRRMEVIKALAEISDKRVLKAIVAALDDEDAGVQNHAAIALGKIGDIEALEPLIHALQYGKDTTGTGGVRKYAAEALGKLGDERAMSALKSALNDRNKAVRDAAAFALDRINPDSQWGKMLKTLRALKPSTEEAIEQLRARNNSSETFTDPKRIIRKIQDEHENYTRIVDMTQSSTAVQVVYDNYVSIGGDIAPATRELRITVVTDGNRFFVFSTGTFF